MSAGSGGHFVKFYDSDFDLVTAVTDFVLPALRTDGVVVIVATPEHTDAVEAALRIAGIDTDAAQSEQRLAFQDAGELLTRLSRAGKPSRDRFEQTVGSWIAGLGLSGRELRVYGEMVALLWDAGDVPAAMELEEMWNDLRARVPFSLLCGYPTHRHSASAGDSEPASGLDSDRAKVSSLHSHVWHGEPPRTASRSFGADISAPHLARVFVADTLHDWRCEAQLDDALLIASELATNAVIHGRADFTIQLFASGDRVRISVYDTADTAPVQVDAPALATGGRGLALVASVSSRWGCDQAAIGKTVWADLPSLPTP